MHPSLLWARSVQSFYKLVSQSSKCRDHQKNQWQKLLPTQKVKASQTFYPKKIQLFLKMAEMYNTIILSSPQASSLNLISLASMKPGMIPSTLYSYPPITQPGKLQWPKLSDMSTTSKEDKLSSTSHHIHSTPKLKTTTSSLLKAISIALHQLDYFLGIILGSLSLTQMIPSFLTMPEVIASLNPKSRKRILMLNMAWS